MRNQTPVVQPSYNLLPTDIDGVDRLAELALDMRWSWKHATDAIWRQLDPALWELTHNPWAVLQTASRDRVGRLLSDRALRETIDGLLRARRQWGGLRFGKVNVTTDGEQHAFEVEVYLGGLDPEALRVELHADGVEDAGPVRREMKRVRPLAGSPEGGLYRGIMSAVRPAADYTARAIPRRAGMALPLEDARITWQR